MLEHLDGIKVKGTYSIDSLKPYLERSNVQNCNTDIDLPKLLDYKYRGLNLKELFEGFGGEEVF